MKVLLLVLFGDLVGFMKWKYMVMWAVCVVLDLEVSFFMICFHCFPFQFLCHMVLRFCTSDVIWLFLGEVQEAGSNEVRGVIC